jgi:hypothetical protein
MVNGHGSSGEAPGESLPELEAAFWKGFYLSRHRRACREDRRVHRVAAFLGKPKPDPGSARSEGLVAFVPEETQP